MCKMRSRRCVWEDLIDVIDKTLEKARFEYDAKNSDFRLNEYIEFIKFDVFIETPGVFIEMVDVFTEMIGVFTANL